jgi:UDP-4-amino-4,6-dideoxy-N-acetyl-beta-L-altrosamine N-acetyltransferase
MAQKEDYKLRPIQEIDIERVLDWRNSDRVRVNMYTDHIIGIEEHRAWFERMQHNENMLYLICEFKDHPIGLVCFTDIDRYNHNCFWGFYLGETDVLQGSGSSMEFLALEYAFDILKIRKLCCEVFDFNEKVIKLHKKFSFVEEGRFIRHRMKNGNYHDIVFLALFREIWQENKEKIARVVFRNQPIN